VTRKKWRIKRTMLVPANWQGTPDHFYHFFLGYFMPTILWQEHSGAREFAVRDCGPMNIWFELARPGSDVEFMPPGVMLERLLSHRQERAILHDWDNPTRFHRSSLDRFVGAVLPRVPGVPRSTGRRITILDRRAAADYYRSEAADSEGSGADRRSLPNVADVAAALVHLGDVTVLDTAGMTPAEQVAELARTDLLVAQHGAGLANMVWMRPGAGVLEIRPPLPPTINEIFANLASARRLGYVAVDQADVHAPVDVSAVVAAAERLTASAEHLVPTMTGSAPVRFLRQLPRRL
jgi:hypothetical protein